jgi:peptidoglycan hydrolase-like protein with peptidoglycan-binding domain
MITFSKYAASIALAGSLLTPTLALAAQPTQVQQFVQMRQGAQGDFVKALQAILAADPAIYPEGIVSGTFGPLTAKAVMRFQKAHGLDQVGQVGPKTQQKLNELLTVRPLAFEEGTTTASTTPGKRVCAAVPPGHLIAPGWLKKNGGAPTVPVCQTLPPGIFKKLGTGTTTPTTGTTDTTAPTISSVKTSAIASTSATITWKTNESATGKVSYGTTAPLVLSVGTNARSKTHVFTLSGLTASTTYAFILESEDAAHNVATTTGSFMTAQ